LIIKLIATVTVGTFPNRPATSFLSNRYPLNTITHLIQHKRDTDVIPGLSRISSTFSIFNRRLTMEVSWKYERFSRKTTKSMVSPAMRSEQHGESGTMKVRSNDCVYVCFHICNCVSFIERITPFY